MRSALLLAALLASVVSAAQARGGHYAGRYGPAHGFSTSPCKRQACFLKHPDGVFRHPNIGGERRLH